ARSSAGTGAAFGSKVKNCDLAVDMEPAPDGASARMKLSVILRRIGLSARTVNLCGAAPVSVWGGPRRPFPGRGDAMHRAYSGEARRARGLRRAPAGPPEWCRQDWPL